MKKAKLLVVFILVTALVLTGCSAIFKGIGDNIVGGIQSELGVSYDSKTGEVTISTSDGNIAVGGNLSWPTDKMGGIPNPNAKITGVISSSGSCTVTFGEFSLEKAQAYYQKIKAIGYENGYDFVDDDGIMYTGFDDKGNSIWFSYDIDAQEGIVIFTSATENNTNQDTE